MKEKIYTIPVNDAFEEACECPLCSMHEKLEQDMLYFVLDNSYMEDDIRMETNEQGFCQAHYQKLMLADNRLGVALMLQTHMQKVQRDLAKLSKPGTSSAKKGLLSKSREQVESKVSAYTHLHKESCYICNRINSTFNIYLDTFFYLWKQDKDFITKVKNSQGFCIHHYSALYDLASIKLSGTAQTEFLNILVPLQNDNITRVLDDLSWYITKFDYRFKDEPWKNSKDAIIRAIKKISSLKI